MEVSPSKIATGNEINRDNMPNTELPTAEQKQRTYYIDPFFGNNMNNGTRKDSAWKDFAILARKHFNSGDTILLKRGGIWNHPLIISQTEKPPQKLKIDAYGKGDPPTIDLQHQLKVGVKIARSRVSLCNIRIKNTLKNGITISVFGGLDDIHLENLEIFNTGKNGIAVAQGGAGLEISNCYLENIRNNGIYLGGSPANRLSHVRIRDCHVKNVLENDGITIHMDLQGNNAGQNFLIENNISELCGEQGFDITAGRRILLRNNTSRNNGQGGILVGNVARQITITGHISAGEPVEKTSAAVNLAAGGDNIRISKSILKGKSYHLLRINTDNVAVFNNTFIYDGGKSPIDLTGKIENIIFMNNIIYSKQKKMGRIRFLESSRPPSHPGFTFKNNIYHVPGNRVRFYYNQKNYSLKALQSRFHSEINSQEKNPLFADPSQENFHLQEKSPALDRGAFHTIATAQMQSNKIKVQNAIFFYTPPVKEAVQHIYFPGTDNSITVSSVDYNNNILTLNRPVNGSFPKETSSCRMSGKIDIGAIEKSPATSEHFQ